MFFHFFHRNELFVYSFRFQVILENTKLSTLDAPKQNMKSK